MKQDSLFFCSCQMASKVAGNFETTTKSGLHPSAAACILLRTAGKQAYFIQKAPMKITQIKTYLMSAGVAK